MIFNYIIFRYGKLSKLDPSGSSADSEKAGKNFIYYVFIFLKFVKKITFYSNKCSKGIMRERGYAIDITIPFNFYVADYSFYIKLILMFF